MSGHRRSSRTPVPVSLKIVSLPEQPRDSGKPPARTSPHDGALVEPGVRPTKRVGISGP